MTNDGTLQSEVDIRLIYALRQVVYEMIIPRYFEHDIMI